MQHGSPTDVGEEYMEALPQLNRSHSITRKNTETQRGLHNFQGTTTQLAETLRDKYLCTRQDPRGQEYLYAGRDNPELDKPFQLYDLKVALAKMKRGTAPGRDKVTVKLLVNLP
ncbi:hypothetical protein HPB49_019042 [Dermacentor silvarum]|uniref:Uncharacterized protein n=1 Tax=Dermacentor silvarum TaxID=543639 RepID=A0ACB8E2C3_DERSI|nr:hypothetical protein HPB49_019042 [Dermacentor silvarum]